MPAGACSAARGRAERAAGVPRCGGSAGCAASFCRLMWWLHGKCLGRRTLSFSLTEKQKSTTASAALGASVCVGLLSYVIRQKPRRLCGTLPLFPLLFCTETWRAQSRARLRCLQDCIATSDSGKVRGSRRFSPLSLSSAEK